MQAVLETPHLLLRPWQEQDLEPLVRLLAKPEVARYLHLDGHPFTREESAEVHLLVLRSWNEQGLGPWAVIDKVTGSWIGKLGLMYQADWPGPDKFEVDYELDPVCWGRGLATEGTQAALRYGFEERRLARIIGATLPEHVASRKVMEKCGLTYQGELPFRHARIVWYALDASTWRQLSREQKLEEKGIDPHLPHTPSRLPLSRFPRPHVARSPWPKH